jgi:hypothetical protein
MAHEAEEAALKQIELEQVLYDPSANFPITNAHVFR